MYTFNDCNWAVCYDIPAGTQDDRKPGRVVNAWFAYPVNAEDYINKALPAESRDRFYIMHRDQIEKEAE